MHNASNQGRALPVDWIPTKDLLLDAENARLASLSGDSGQENLLRILWSEMAVDEVAMSIAENGFYTEEALLVIPADTSKKHDTNQKFIVVEGNRRLAAVQLLIDEKLRQLIRATNLLEISKDAQERLKVLPAIKYPDRKALWAYLGFRHINGTQPWDAFSKAKYVANVHEKYNVPLEEIAQKIGDRHATVVRLYRGYKILEQAETQAGFDKEDRVRNRFYFSHLYTATDQIEFQKFLGITSEGSLKPNPIPKTKLPELKEFMIWLYGQKSTNKEPLVKTQSPDLNYLRQAISKNESLSAIRSGYSLQRSYEISIGDKRRFREAMVSAKEELQQANATVITGYSGEDDLYKTAEEITLYATAAFEKMKAIREQKLRGSK